MTQKEKLQNLRDRIDKHIETLFFAYDEQNYGYLVGLITAYNIMCKKGKEIKTMPGRPDIWLKEVNEAAQKEQELKPKLWMPDNKIIA